MQTTPPAVRCRHCDGSGQQPLESELFRLLLRIQHKGGICAGDFNGHAPVTNFQLEKLRGYGLVKRTKDGRKWLYTLAK
jgi:hypothetical protein